MTFAHEVASSRPPADPGIAQFLMQPDDLEAQANRVGPFLADKRVFFLGDDDHLSPMFAKDFGVTPVVYEIDERIIESLAEWFDRLAISDSVVQSYDVIKPVVIESPCDAFYINPPYSSLSKGLGIKVWLMRSIEACKPHCTGVLVMPRDGGNIDKDWVQEVQDSVDEFLADNGFSIVKVDSNVSEYAETTDVGLKSSNVYLVRTNPEKVRSVRPRKVYN